MCSVSETFRWRKSLWLKGVGVLRSSVEKIFTVPKNFRGIFYCFRRKKGADGASTMSAEKFSLSQKLSAEKVSQKVTSRVSVEKFFSHIKNSGESTASLKKNLGIRGGKHDNSSKNFRLPVPKNFVEEPFCSVFQKFSGSEKVYG